MEANKYSTGLRVSLINECPGASARWAPLCCPQIPKWMPACSKNVSKALCCTSDSHARVVRSCRTHRHFTKTTPDSIAESRRRISRKPQRPCGTSAITKEGIGQTLVKSQIRVAVVWAQPFYPKKYTSRFLRQKTFTPTGKQLFKQKTLAPETFLPKSYYTMGMVHQRASLQKAFAQRFIGLQSLTLNCKRQKAYADKRDLGWQNTIRLREPARSWIAKDKIRLRRGAQPCVLQSTATCYSVLQNTGKYFSVLQSTTKY